MGRFCRGLRSRDRPHSRAFARSPELVLGMVYVDHSPNGNGRMRLSHNTLVPTVAARVETPSSALRQISALGQADICAAISHVRFAPKSGLMQCSNACPLWANSGHDPRVSGSRYA